jgi:hypothetical protein
LATAGALVPVALLAATEYVCTPAKLPRTLQMLVVLTQLFHI